MAAEVHVGDIGTEFRVQVQDQDGVNVDVTVVGAVRKIYFKKPDGTIVPKTAVAGSTEKPTLLGTDGWMHYITIAGDVDQSGKWYIEGWVQIPPNEWTTEEATFQVRQPKWKP